MNKKEFATSIVNVLKANNVRKPVCIKKHIFHISDDFGNSADFNIKSEDKMVIYTIDDVINILDAGLSVVEEAIKRGEEISFHGYGVLGVHKRAARRVKNVETGEWCDVSARYVPKFTFGNLLRMAAKVYEMSLGDFDSIPDLPEPDYYDYDEEDDL